MPSYRVLFSRPALALALLVGFVAPACDCDSGGGITNSGGQLTLDPEQADFGYVIVGQQKQLKVLVRNTGRGTIKVRSIDRSEGFPGEILFSPPNFQLEPNEETSLTLLFQPKEVGPRQGTLLLRNDGFLDPVELPVAGVGIVPNLAFDPASVNFGPVIVDNVGEQSAKLVNRGDAPIDVFVDGISGDNAEMFRALIPGSDQTHAFLEAGASIDVALSFEPKAVGEGFKAAFSVRPCTACEPTLLPLEGRGVAAGIIAEPEELNFGAVLPGTTSTKTLTLRNIGNKRIAVTSIQPAQAGTEFGVVQPAQWPALEPGESSTVDVTYSPAALGQDSTRLVVETDDQRAPRFEVTVLGYGGGPSLDVLPAALEFNTVGIGFPVKRRLTLVNKGINDPNSDNDDLLVTALSLPVGDFAYSLPNGGALPLRLSPGSRAIVEVTYSPTDSGEDFATLQVSSNDGDRPTVDVPVHGTGRPLPPCEYEMLPAAVPGLQFGVVQRGRNARLSFSIRNIGTNDCSLGAIELDPSANGVFTLPAGPVFGKILTPGERLVTEVEFAPPGTAASGTAYASFIDISVSSVRAPQQQLQLSGRGAEVCLSITPMGVDFGTVEPNCETNNRTFTIYNACRTAVKINSIVTSAGTSEFRVLPPTNLPTTLQPQQQLRFDARYRPVDLGQDNGSIEVYTDQTVTGNPPQPYVLTLTGKGEVDATARETFRQADQARADILFVVDDSGSMSSKQQALATNFSSFMRFAIQQQIDYRIAVTTTAAASGGCNASDDAQGRFMPLNSSTRIVTPALPDPLGTFSTNVRVGASGCASEQGMEGGWQALSDPNINGTNAGFLRNDAYLSIIMVSDAEDQSIRPVDFYVNFFQNIKGPRGANLVSVSAIVNHDNSICENNPNADTPEDSNPALRYMEVVRRTGGVLESICTDDWSRSLQKLGQSAFGYKSRFILNSEPDPATLRVVVTQATDNACASDAECVSMGGANDTCQAGFCQAVREQPGTWNYTPETNSVDFLPTWVPPAGAKIDVSYAVACH
jgi:hypothetical protein